MPQVIVTEEAEKADGNQGFASRHPKLAFVFGDAVCATYVVGCLALDLFAPLQILDLLAGPPLWAVPALVLAFGFLAFLEYLLYRRLWPPRAKRQIVED